VDPSILHPGARLIKFDVPDCYLLFVGTLEPRKNLDFLLKAWIEIKDDHQDTWLMIVGTEGNVFRAVDLAPDMERVRFPGYLNDETLAGLYASATLFVLPSQDEGFGLPALEAMASGTPVIVSDGGALPEVVGEAGMSFCLSDPDTLVSALRECLSNPGLRAELREKGLTRAREFSWQTAAEIVWKGLHDI